MIFKAFNKFCSTKFTLASSLGLEKFGIKSHKVYRNLSVPELYELGLSNNIVADPDTKPNAISSNGAYCSYSGTRTGRSPKDKRIVCDDYTKDDIWWGDVNIPLEVASFRLLEDLAINYLNTKKWLYVVDGYAGWDPKFRIKIRIICTRAYHALFMRNMLIMPTQKELQSDFNDVDYVIFNAGEYFASSQIKGVTDRTSVSLNFTQRKSVILGTQYAGEMKKGVFTIMHYLMPKRGVLSLHSSANEGKNGDVTLLFGLSGTGKTTLSADPNRKLIGDDEHCWSSKGVFNIEGGCYAKCVGLTREKEPEIFDAIRFGTVLENVKFYNENTREVNYNDISITENTRASYPLEFIDNAKFPAMGGHPKNIIFLTCDAYGVLPPVSKLTPEQAMYHFISGYTAKVAGTEMGVKEPTATFSACFGEAFLPLHPGLYAQMLSDKIKKHGTNVWLINTGWSGGKYGVGERMSLKNTRAIIDAIHSGELEKAEYENFDVFNIAIPKNVTNVKSQLLNPKNTWANAAEFDQTLKMLAEKFVKNFKKYETGEYINLKQGGPKL